MISNEIEEKILTKQKLLKQLDKDMDKSIRNISTISVQKRWVKNEIAGLKKQLKEVVNE